VAELDLEREMGESIAEGPAMTQDEEVGKSECDELMGEKELKAVAKVIKLSTVSKGKQKVAPVKMKVYSEIDGLVGGSAKVIVNMLLTYHTHSATTVLLGRRSHCAS
jgi:hypothetical protein